MFQISTAKYPKMGVLIVRVHEREMRKFGEPEIIVELHDGTSRKLETLRRMH